MLWVFIWSEYCDDSALFPDVRDLAVSVGVVADVCDCPYSVWACLRWKLLMESGPVTGEFLILLMCFVVRRMLRCGLYSIGS